VGMDKASNMTEKTVDVSMINPENSSYAKMFDYFSYLTDSGKCPNV